MEKLRTRYKQLQQVSLFSTNSSDAPSDEDDPDVVRVEEKRQTIWESLNPWFGNSSDRLEDGFHPYQISDGGSLTVPKRPASKMSPRYGSSSAGLDMSAWNSGYNSPNRTSVEAARSAPLQSNFPNQGKKKTKSWGRWLGLRSEDSGCI
ncbi:hypothetical protein F4824DRAFT_448672 [Ustulina deusta]|nr:hypothetical protein F4824DRAFT_448672 [Ustulina deusta]